ncbi:MAG: SMI1/KNR4 family protein [Lachnospiraceae bacterium]|nr:SMI1/KNR4 family protein [Lachnospiraceae bacterium]
MMEEKMIKNFKKNQDNIQTETEFEFTLFLGDYRGYLYQWNGGVGMIGDNSFLNLWKLKEIVELNKEYEVNEYLTNVILIGSDGADTAYGINAQGKYIEVPFIGMDDAEVEIIADSFEKFIQYLYLK